jgi:hypothetical protein
LEIQELAMNSNIEVSTLCLNDAFLHPYIDKIVIGLDNVENLIQNLNSVNYIKQVKLLQKKLSKFEVVNEDILLPYKWIK